MDAGSRLGRYLCLKRLARGGMAELHLARLAHERGFEKFFAIKRVLPHLAEDEHFVQMFLREARLAAALEHPHIVQVTDFGTEDGEPYLVMEYLHGRDVRAVLKRATDGPTPLQFALAVVRDVAEALHYAHEGTLGLVHRDVSPSNIFITYNGIVKLLDFGVAKASALTRATRTGTLKGKLGYMSPEQGRGDAVDRRSDVFSLGVVLYELTTGRRAFYGDNEFAIMNKASRVEFDAPETVVEGYPEALAGIVSRALTRDPNERYVDARAMQEDIESFAADAGLVLSEETIGSYVIGLFPPPSHPRDDRTLTEVAVAAEREPKLRRRASAWRVGAALAVGIGLGVVGMSLRSDTEPRAPEPGAEPTRASVGVGDAAAPPAPANSAAAPAVVGAGDGAAAQTQVDVRRSSGPEPNDVLDDAPTQAKADRKAKPRPARKTKRGRRRGKAKAGGSAPPIEAFRPPSERG